MQNNFLVTKEFATQHIANSPSLYVTIFLLTQIYPDSHPKEIGDTLLIPEGEVIRAWSYWANQTITEDFEYEYRVKKYLSQNSQSSVNLLSQPTTFNDTTTNTNTNTNTVKANNNISSIKAPIINEVPESNVIYLQERPNYEIDELNYGMKNEELVQIKNYIQVQLGKPLQPSDINVLYGLYDWIGLTTDVIRILFEFCFETGFKNIKYTEKIAMTWKEKGILDAETARKYVELQTNGFSKILSYFGIYDRCPTEPEIVFFTKWISDYNTPLELIKIACEKTILNIGKIKHSYTNSIIEKWHLANIKTVEDVEANDKDFISKNKFDKNKINGNKNFAKSKATNKFINHNQRDWDFNEIDNLLAEEIKKNTIKG